MTSSAADPKLLPEGSCALPDLGVIEAQGPEAAQFLHNQLSNDVLLLPVGQARLAAWCNAKGRMQASMVVIKTSAESVLLVLSRELLPQTLKRLSMFVMRSRLKLSDASAQWAVHGLLGQAAQPAGLEPGKPWQAWSADAGAWSVELYPAVLGQIRIARALQLKPAASAAAEAPTTEMTEAHRIWIWCEVLSGVPLLTPPLFEAFVPQMLNYESVGGVNFKKGCYPGQEVVARSQFRGTLKRRMARVHSPVALVAGQEVFTPADPEQSCATVVLCAARPDGEGFDALVSGTLESQSTGWHAISATGPALTVLALPYPLLEDI
jgi:tRNA-modifying protein YgfZ